MKDEIKQTQKAMNTLENLLVKNTRTSRQSP
jgi:hypothetical protein